ncbi:hypothetical protein [Ketobacter alkanivorans]|uniref:Uncharacterized protein n=1 Tax=Ketobacter alkanivorans TaxID=1917421 RepID=A0A2K9LLK3_9GAMM|nr:hypothetical protein [Ketobacter alkanivorans]AUM13143.1 hypothetical protein Kalk_12220 [Ketobacter alkanivorans]
MISVKKHAVRINFLIIISLVLWGCGGGTPKILNGEPITGLSGNFDTVKTFSITLPEDTQGLLLSVVGSVDVQAELLSSDGASILICQPMGICPVNSPVAGDYELKLTATNDYENVVVAATWGGPTESVLKNDVALVELALPAGSVRLASVFLPENGQVLSLKTTHMGEVGIRVLDGQAQLRHECFFPLCSVSGLESGLYFVEIYNTAEFTGASLTASWGIPLVATLENGLPKRGLSGGDGEWLHETLYFPEQAETLVVVSSKPDVELVIADQQGNAIHFCSMSVPCFVTGLDQGLYTVAARILSASDDFSITAAWAGAPMTSLQNGSARLWDDIEPGNHYLDSFVMPVDAAFVAVAPLAESVHQQVFNAQGERIADCWFEHACILPELTAGLYFVNSHVSESAAHQQFSVALNYGGPNYNSLGRHENKQNIDVPASGYVVETFTAQPQDRRGVFFTSHTASFEIYAEDGSKLPCDPYSLCDLNLDGARSYIAYVRSNDVLVDTLSVAFSTWTNAGGSVQHRESVPVSLSGPYDVMVETIAVPEDADSFMVALPSASVSAPNSVFIEIFQPGDTWPRDVCNSNELCIIPNYGSNDYVVLVQGLMTDLQQPITSNWSLTFAGQNYTTIGNGEINSYEDMQAGDSIVESIFIPESIGLMRFAASFNGIVDVFGANGERYCHDSYQCFVETSANTAFYARVTLGDDLMPSLNTAMAYGMAEMGSLSNGDRREAILGNEYGVIIESFYVPEGTQSGMVAAYSQNSDVYVSIYSSNGAELCHDQGHCSFFAREPGVYFVELSAGSKLDPSTDIRVNYSLILASETDTSIQGNASFFDLNLQSGEVHLASFYLKDHINSFSLIATPDVDVRMYDSFGNEIHLNNVVLNLPEGMYFLQMTNLYDTTEFTAGYSIALGGEENTTMQRGLPAVFPYEAGGIGGVQSFYIPEGVESIILKSSPSPLSLNIYHESEDYGMTRHCYNVESCVLLNPLPGTYFVHTYSPVYPSDLHEEYLLTMQYVGSAVGGSMINGEYVSFDGGVEGQYWIQSFYVDADNMPLAFGATENLAVSFYFEDGTPIELYGSGQSLFYDYGLPAGGYYAVMELLAWSGRVDWYDGVSAKVMWGDAPTLDNGESITTGDANFVMESFYAVDGAEENYPDIYAGMVSASIDSGQVIVASEYDRTECFISIFDTCWFDAFRPGMYFMMAQTPNYEGRGPNGMSLAWGGPNGTSLQNGVEYQTSEIQLQLFEVQSMYVDVPRTINITASGHVYIELRNGYPGEVVETCQSGCELELQPGLYFMHFSFFGPSVGESYRVDW